MRVLILNTDYEAFLADLYAKNLGLAESSYDRQMAVRNASLFGAADFYSEGLKANGVEAADIHLNNRAMQLRWAVEHGVNLHGESPAEPRGISATIRRLFGRKRGSSAARGDA